MLLAHAVPNDIVVGEIAPAATDLGSLAKRYGIERTENLVGEFVGQGRKEIDLELFLDFAGDCRELRKATLRNNALEHQLTVLGGRGREERPDVGDGLLVCRRKTVQFLKR